MTNTSVYEAMHFEIIVGSMLGASEYVAEALAECLKARNIAGRLHLQPDFHKLDPTAIWLLCSSTHGAGDLPDNIQPFAAALQGTQLHDTRYLVVGLGDSSYDTFCFAAKQLDTLLADAGAHRLTSPLFIDVLTHPIPEEVAVEWFDDWLSNHRP